MAVTAGFVLLAAGLFIGATTSAGSSGLFVAAWMAVAGLGTGIAMATAMSAALVELSAEKSGVGSAVLQAVNKTGAPFGIAILGSVLSAGYLARLDLSGLPSAAAAVVRQSVFGGVAVAQKLHSPALLASVQTAFVHGMDMALLVSAGIALVGRRPHLGLPAGVERPETARNRQCNRAQAQTVAAIGTRRAATSPDRSSKRSPSWSAPVGTTLAACSPSRPGIPACPGPCDRAGGSVGPGRQPNDVKYAVRSES